MENFDRPKYFAIRKDRRVSLKTQEQAARSAGYDPRRFVYLHDVDLNELVGETDPAKLEKTQKPERFMLRQGYQLGIYRYDLLVPLKSEDGEKRPRTKLEHVTDKLLEIGVFVEELEPRRTCKDNNGVYEMYRDAVRRLAGNTGVSRRRGRPAKIRSDEDIKAAKAIWESVKYASNQEAVDAMPGGDWTLSEANERFGGSGRQGGRKKQTK